MLQYSSNTHPGIFSLENYAGHSFKNKTVQRKRCSLGQQCGYEEMQLKVGFPKEYFSGFQYLTVLYKVSKFLFKMISSQPTYGIFLYSRKLTLYKIKHYKDQLPQRTRRCSQHFSLGVKQGVSSTTMRKQNSIAPQIFFQKYCLS